MSDPRNPFSQPARRCPHCGSAAVTSVGHVLRGYHGDLARVSLPNCSREFSVQLSRGQAPFGVTGDRPVYHDDTRCSEGNRIELRDRRPGTGGRPQCARCAAERP